MKTWSQNEWTDAHIMTVYPTPPLSLQTNHTHCWVMFSDQTVNECSLADLQESYFWQTLQFLNAAKTKVPAGQVSPVVWVQADSASPACSTSLLFPKSGANTHKPAEPRETFRFAADVPKSLPCHSLPGSLSLAASLTAAISLRYQFISTESCSRLRHCQLLHKTLYGSHMYLGPSAPD